MLWSSDSDLERSQSKWNHNGVRANLVGFRTTAEFVYRIRSNTEIRIFLLEAVVVIYSFTAAAFRSDWPSIPNDPAALPRLLGRFPQFAALFGLYCCAMPVQIRRSGRRTPPRSM